MMSAVACGAAPKKANVAARTQSSFDRMIVTPLRTTAAAAASILLPATYEHLILDNVNAFDTPSDERVLRTPNWSQPGPTSVRPGWPLSHADRTRGAGKQPASLRWLRYA